MQTGVFYGIGIGPGDPELLTLKAARLLSSCDVIFTVISSHSQASISETIIGSLRPRGRIVRLVFSMSRDRAEREALWQENVERIADELRKGHSCAYATLGDALSYATCGYMLPRLRELLPDLRAEIVPGITSWSTLAARAGTVLVEGREPLHVVPSFSEDMAHKIDFEPGSSTILLKTYRSRRALTARLRNEPDVDVLYGEHLTQEGEFLSRDLDAIDARPETYLSLMLVRKRRAAAGEAADGKAPADPGA